MLSRFLRCLSAPPTERPKFSFGDVKLSEKVQWLNAKGLIDPLHYLQRHVRGDWGNVSEAERTGNQAALDADGPIASFYSLTPRMRLLVMTNDERTLTVIQLADENAML